MKSDYRVSDYLGALVGDFIRGKKLQEEEGEQREQNESEEILASFYSQRTNVILPIKQPKTKGQFTVRNFRWKRKNKTTQHQCAECTYLRRAWRWGGNHLLNAVVKKGQASVLVTDKGALFNEADEYLGLGELGVELLVCAVSAFKKPCRKGKCGITSQV